MHDGEMEKENPERTCPYMMHDLHLGLVIRTIYPFCYHFADKFNVHRTDSSTISLRRHGIRCERLLNSCGFEI